MSHGAKESDMNVGKMLVQLGFTPVRTRFGLPCPAVISSREPAALNDAWMIESKPEVEACIDMHKTVGERAITKRYLGDWS